MFASIKRFYHRYLTVWVEPDPDPQYSRLDRLDGLGRNITTVGDSK